MIFASNMIISQFRNIEQSFHKDSFCTHFNFSDSESFSGIGAEEDSSVLNIVDEICSQ